MWWRWQDKDFESAIATLEAGIQAWHKQAYPYAEKEQPFGMLRREDILEAVRMLPGNEDLPEWKDMDALTKVRVATQGAAVPGLVYGIIAQAVAAGMTVRDWVKLHPRGRTFAPAKWKTTKEGRLVIGKIPEPPKGKPLPKRFIPARLELKFKFSEQIRKPGVSVSPGEVLEEFVKPLRQVERMVDKVEYQRAFQRAVAGFLEVQNPQVELPKLAKAAEQISNQMFQYVPAEMTTKFAATLVDAYSMAPRLMKDATEQFRATGEYVPRERELTAAQKALARRKERLAAKPKEVKLLEEPKAKTPEDIYAAGKEAYIEIDRAIVQARGDQIYQHWDNLRKDKDMDREERVKRMALLVQGLQEVDDDIARYALKRIKSSPGDLPKSVSALFKEPKIPPMEYTIRESMDIANVEYAKRSDVEHISEEAAHQMAYETVSKENWEGWEFQQMLPPVPPEKITEPEMREMFEKFDVNLRVQLDSFEHWAMSYQTKTGVPVYSNAARPLIEAGKTRKKDNRYYDRYITGIFKGLSKDEIVDLTLFMKEKQVRGEAIGTLPPNLAMKEQEVRAMFDYGFQKFGVAPETYIVNYLPLLSEKERTRLSQIPVHWRGIPSEIIPFFMHARERMGEVIDAFTVEDLLRLYFTAGSWAEYRKKVHVVGESAKGFPRPAYNEVRKLEVFLVGGVSDFDKAIRTSIREFLKTATGGRIDEDSDAMTALVNTVYLGTIAGNPGSAIKNLTQSFHNWSEMPAPWMAVGNKLYFSKEGRNIIHNSGIEMGFAPYVQREIERYYGKSRLRKLVKKQAHLRNIGMFLFQAADHYNRGTIYLAEWSRMNHYIDLLKAGKINEETLYKKCDFAGLHPVISDMATALIKEKKWEAAVDMVADQRQAMTQWRYQREIRPQWMRSGAGRIGGQFLTWPTYGVVMHAGRFKRAAEAFGRGEKPEGLYQLWKEIKWIGMVAATVYAGKKAGLRLWPWFMFLPTQALAALQPAISAYQAAVYKSEGYNWLAAKKWREAKWSAKIFAPFGVEVANIVKSLEIERPAKAIGLPVYKREKDVYGPGVDVLEEWLREEPITLEKWLLEGE